VLVELEPYPLPQIVRVYYTGNELAISGMGLAGQELNIDTGFSQHTVTPSNDQISIWTDALPQRPGVIRISNDNGTRDVTYSMERFRTFALAETVDLSAKLRLQTSDGGDFEWDAEPGYASTHTYLAPDDSVVILSKDGQPWLRAKVFNNTGPIEFSFESTAAAKVGYLPGFSSRSDYLSVMNDSAFADVRKLFEGGIPGEPEDFSAAEFDSIMSTTVDNIVARLNADTVESGSAGAAQLTSTSGSALDREPTITPTRTKYLTLDVEPGVGVLSRYTLTNGHMLPVSVATRAIGKGVCEEGIYLPEPSDHAKAPWAGSVSKGRATYLEYLYNKVMIHSPMGDSNVENTVESSRYYVDVIGPGLFNLNQDLHFPYTDACQYQGTQMRLFVR
jgi:hypothetical protein